MKTTGIKSIILALTIPVSAVVAEETVTPTPAAEAPAAAVDFGDQSSSTLTTKAWEAFERKDHAAVDAFTGRCIELYEKQALEMQASLSGLPESGKEHDYWALNDVGVCYFIRGQSREARNDSAGAVADYKMVVEKLSYAQCWDTKGWFWRPSDAAASRITALEFDSIE